MVKIYRVPNTNPNISIEDFDLQAHQGHFWGHWRYSFQILLEILKCLHRKKYIICGTGVCISEVLLTLDTAMSF